MAVQHVLMAQQERRVTTLLMGLIWFTTTSSIIILLLSTVHYLMNQISMKYSVVHMENVPSSVNFWKTRCHSGVGSFIGQRHHHCITSVTAAVSNKNHRLTNQDQSELCFKTIEARERGWSGGDESFYKSGNKLKRRMRRRMWKEGGGEKKEVEMKRENKRAGWTSVWDSRGD